MSSTVNANGKRPHIEEEDDQQEAIREAETPFNQPTADFIIRSADHMDFRVHKAVLSLATPVFETMFSLPKTRSGSSSQEKKDGLPVITLPEPSVVLDALLRLCYPTTAPTITNFTHAARLYEALDKYAMEPLMEYAMEILVKTTSQQPLAAYALGCRFHIEGLILAAAKETLKTPIKDLEYTPELDRITGADILRLIQYQEKCKVAASRLAFTDRSWIPNLSAIPLGTKKRGCSACSHKIFFNGKNLDAIPGAFKYLRDDKEVWSYWCPRWWTDYMERAEDSLQRWPRGSTVKSKEVLGPALLAAVDCEEATACRSGTQALVDFSEIFAKAVEDAIEKASPFLIGMQFDWILTSNIWYV